MRSVKRSPMPVLKKLKATGIVLLLLIAISVEAKTELRKLDRSRFQIGAYRLQTWAQTEEHIRDIRDCGLDYITGVLSKSEKERRRVFALFDKYNLYAVVTDALKPLDSYRGRCRS